MICYCHTLQLLKGNSGILFTNQSLSAVKKFFANYCKDHYATAGIIAPKTITIPEGKSSVMYRLCITVATVHNSYLCTV